MSEKGNCGGRAPWELARVPAKGRSWAPVAKPSASTPLVATILSQRPLAVVLHWRDKDAVLCVGLENGCAACKLGLGKKVSLFVAALREGDGARVGVEITGAAMDSYPGEELQDPRCDLRGWRMRLSRKSTRRGAPLVLAMLPPVGDSAALPEAFNVREWVAKLYDAG